MSSISIALGTCNGARFLNEQFASLVAQHRPPNEVVIGDDNSDDDSIRLSEKFASSAPFPVRIIGNDVRLGVRGNFEQIIRCCSSDLIALCDQDDVWQPQKLNDLHACFENTSEVVAAFSDAVIVDDTLQALGYTMWKHIGFSRRRQEQMAGDRPWEVLFKDPVVTGATLVFRKDLVAACLPIPEGWIHDAWIAQIAAAHGQIVAQPEPLILYRQHPANVIGGKRLSLRAQLRNAESLGRLGLAKRESLRYQQLLDRLRALDETHRLKIMRDLTVAKLEHLHRRRLGL